MLTRILQLTCMTLAIYLMAAENTIAQGRAEAILGDNGNGRVLFQRYETNPLWGSNFWCFVTNVSPTETVQVLNVRIHDGKDGHQINKGGAAHPIMDCFDKGVVTLAPNQSCGVRGDPQDTGAKLVPTAAHCVFYANGPIRGTLEVRYGELTVDGRHDERNTAEAKPHREH